MLTKEKKKKNMFWQNEWVILIKAWVLDEGIGVEYSSM